MSRSGWIRAWKWRPGRQVVHQFQRGDLDHPVTELRLQAGGFRVEQDGAGHRSTSLISRLSAFADAWCRDRPVRIDDVGAASLLGVGHLARDHRRDVRRRSSAGGRGRGASEPSAAPRRRRCDRRADRRRSPTAAGMSSTTARAPRRRARATKARSSWRTIGCRMRLQPGQRLRFAQHRLTQRHAVHRAVAHRAGKRCLDRAHGAAAARLQPVHRGIGVEHRECAPGGTPRRRSTCPCRCRRSGRG